ncbi:MAG: helix-turn-helix transcriptional regulator [Dactylosporangium sp.]|nr:winged helix-turn-helix transcriptional regulator [Dactylosporangium sp.]NNJ59529.1 helix-turn-helix transcriptional regulator [Dactylosporangium sp.]
MSALPDGLETIQEIFGRKWARHILRALHKNPLRYTEIQHRVTLYADHTVHSRTLTETLRWLEGQRYLEKHHDPEADRYRLTSLGEGYARIIQDLRDLNADRSFST